MNKGMNILYQVHNNLYVNLTNRCPCACTFCLRQTMDSVAADDATLWLEHEPEVEEVIAEFDKFDMSVYDEVVFCGYGEPTERRDVLLSVAKYVKEHFHKPIRINTNGLANLIWEKDVTPELKGLIDTVSISLNTPNAQRYHELVRSRFGEKSFDAMLAFAKEATIEKAYPNIFVVRYEENNRNVTYSYTDVLTRTVEVDVFDGENYSPLIPPQIELKRKKSEILV